MAQPLPLNVTLDFSCGAWDNALPLWPGNTYVEFRKINFISAVCFFGIFLVILFLLFINDRRARSSGEGTPDSRHPSVEDRVQAAHERVRQAPFLLTLHWRIFFLCGVQAFILGCYKLVNMTPGAGNMDVKTLQVLAQALEEAFSKLIERFIVILLVRDIVGSKVTIRALLLSLVAALVFFSVYMSMVMLPDEQKRCALEIPLQLCESTFYACCLIVARSRKCAKCERTIYVCGKHNPGCDGKGALQWKDGSAVLFCGALMIYYFVDACRAALCFAAPSEVAFYELDKCVNSINVITYALLFSPIVYICFRKECNYWRNLVCDHMGGLDQLLSSTPNLDTQQPAAFLARDMGAVIIPKNQLKKDRLVSSMERAEISLYFWHTEQVVVKRYRSRFLNLELGGDTFEQLVREAKMQRALKHPSIIGWKGMYFDLPTAGIVMEFCANGTLKEFLQNRKNAKERFDGNQVKMLDVVLGLAKGLRYMHKQRVLHRDVKSENVLMDDEWHCKIIDFDVAVRFDTEPIRGEHLVGTNPYIAPEIWAGKNYSTKSDVYAFAMVLWECLTFGNLIDSVPQASSGVPASSPRNIPTKKGRFSSSKKATPNLSSEMDMKAPLLSPSPDEVKVPISPAARKGVFRSQFLSEIKDAVCEQRLRPGIPPNLIPEFKELLTDCWSHEPLQRPSFDEIVARLKAIREKGPENWDHLSFGAEVERQTSAQIYSRSSASRRSASFLSPPSSFLHSSDIPSLNMNFSNHSYVPPNAVPSTHNMMSGNPAFATTSTIPVTTAATTSSVGPFTTGHNPANNSG